jgi:hypothetical protein
MFIEFELALTLAPIGAKHNDANKSRSNIPLLTELERLLNAIVSINISPLRGFQHELFSKTPASTAQTTNTAACSD